MSIYRFFLVFWWLLAGVSCGQPDSVGIAHRQDHDTIRHLLSYIESADLERPDQLELTDRALRMLDTMGYDTFPESLYIRTLEILEQVSDSARMRDFLLASIRKSRLAGDTLALGRFQNELSSFYRNHNILDSAFLYANSSFELFSAKRENYWTARSLYNMAVAQYFASDYMAAERTAIDGLEFMLNARSEDRENRLVGFYNVLGTIAYSLDAHDRSLGYYEKANDHLTLKTGFNRSYFTLLNNIGTAQLEMGNYRDAESNFRAVTTSDSVAFLAPRLYARSLVNLARSQLMLGKTDSVESYYLQALSIRESLDDLLSLPRSYYFLAEYYLGIGDTLKAQDHLERGKSYATDLDELDGLRDILRLQIRTSPAMAYLYAQELDELQDSLLLQERSLREKFHRVQFETDQYIAENRLLTRQRLLWISIAAGTLMLGISFLVIVLQRIRNQKLIFQQQQQETNQEIFNLMLSQNEKIEVGKQEEQKRISEELHDGVLGEMNGIRMVLLGLNNKDDGNSMAMRSEAIEKLKVVQEEIRGISHALSDAAYQKFHNFILSIEDLVSGTCKPADLTYRIDYDSDTDWDSLDGLVKINLYRIIQECLQNVIKHAGATEVFVQLESDTDQLTTRIRDNGRGFQRKRGKRGIGHKNIDSRVSKVGGSWTVETALGRGTEVRITIPRCKEHIE